MARHFPDFLEAYNQYARDGFVPDEFHEWTGRSILAAALERKVSLKNGRIYYTPNIFVMLVSHPAVGKSTAIDAGVDLLEAVRKYHNPNFRFIPEKTTEPGIIDLMKITDRVPLSTNPNISIPQSAGFFYAREASDSALNGKNTVGDVVAIMTALYDCPKWYRKKTQSMPHPIEIENACMNLLSGATFNFLQTLVNEQSVLGGFASRLIYVVSHERKVRKTKWGATREFDHDMTKKLVEDLAHINKLAGPMKASPEFIEKWEAWQPEFDKYLIGLGSEKLEAIMSRKGTNAVKLSMLLSVSESDSLIVEGRHFDRALEIIESAYKDNASIIATAAIANKTSQSGVNQAVSQLLQKNKGTMQKFLLRQLLLANGNPAAMIEETLEAMERSKWIGVDHTSGLVTLLINSNRHL